MEQVSTRERMREEYAHLVKEFAKQVRDLDVSGILAPHVPIVGDNYDACSYKMAAVRHFCNAVLHGPVAILYQ